MLTIDTNQVDQTARHNHPNPAAPGRQATPAAAAIGVHKTYGQGDVAVTALAGVDVELATGCLTAVMGPSGSGKSTLMQTMAGLDRIDAGSVMIGDTDLTTLSERQLTKLRRDRIGFIFQAFNLVPMLSAQENIELPIRLAGRKADRAWIDEVVEIVGLAERRDHRPTELSGGQQQRVAVARSLASRPEIIFADEPTGNLDRNAAAEVLGLLRRVAREDGQTIAMVTHDPVAATYADRTIFLADGRIVAEQTNPTVDSVLDVLRDLER
jgi:putative ABC transport system ATP-binding protein